MKETASCATRAFLCTYYAYPKRGSHGMCTVRKVATKHIIIRYVVWSTEKILQCQLKTWNFIFSVASNYLQSRQSNSINNIMKYSLHSAVQLLAFIFLFKATCILSQQEGEGDNKVTTTDSDSMNEKTMICLQTTMHFVKMDNNSSFMKLLYALRRHIDHWFLLYELIGRSVFQFLESSFEGRFCTSEIYFFNWLLNIIS